MSSPSPKYFKAWIIFFLIAMVGGMIFGGFIGGVVGFLLSLPLSYFTYRWTVSEFIVKGLTQPLPPVIPQAPPSVASTPHPTA